MRTKLNTKLIHKYNEILFNKITNSAQVWYIDNDENLLFRDYDYCPKANIVNKAFWATIKSIKSSIEVAEHLQRRFRATAAKNSHSPVIKAHLD